jgi:hypothetical protein
MNGYSCSTSSFSFFHEKQIITVAVEFPMQSVTSTGILKVLADY